MPGLSTAQRVALRHVRESASKEESLAPLLVQAQTELKKYKAWSESFSVAMKNAQTKDQGLPEGYVWQEQFRDFWAPFWPIETRLLSLLEEIEELGASNKSLKNLVKEAGPYLDPPRGARNEDPIRNPEFYTHPNLGSSQIAYPEKDIQQWYSKFSTWVDEAIRGLSKVIAKAA